MRTSEYSWRAVQLSIALLSLIFVVGALVGCSMMNHQTHAHCAVTNKEQRQHVSGSDGDTHTSYQKLVTTSCGVFEVDDTIAGGWQSYDRWAVIEVGKTYDITTGGYRWWGGFPSVIGIKEVNA